MAVRGVEASSNDPKYIKALETQLDELSNNYDSLASKVDATSRAPRTVNDTPDVDISGTALPDGGVNPTRRFTPSAPAGLNAATAISFDNGLPFVSISIGYERVTNALAGDPITIARHELQGRGPLAEWSTLTSSSGTATVVNHFPLPVGEDWEFRMRAVSAQGITGPYSEILTVTLPADTTPPPIPSTPYLSARLGTVNVAWDGLTATGTAMPSDFAFVEVQQSSDDVTFVKVDSLRTLGSSIITGLPYEDTFYFRLLAVDGSGNRSPAGASDSVVVTPLVDTDAVGLIIDGANIVPGSIDAADKIIGNTITGGLIQALAINAGHIQANAITADKIEAGAITGIKIAANTITADNLLIGGTNGDNLLEDPGLLVGIPSWGIRPDISGGPGGSAINSVVATRFTRYIHIDAVPGAGVAIPNASVIPCVPGGKFLATYTHWNGGGAGFRVELVFIETHNDGTSSVSRIVGAAGNLADSSSYTYTAPAGVVKFTVQFEVYNSTTPVGFAVPTLQRMTTGSLIVDGAIDGKTITGAVVRTAASGARVQLDSTGLHAFNSGGTEVTTISAATGQVTALGTFRTATSGPRGELTGVGLSVYPATGAAIQLVAGDSGGVDGRYLQINTGSDLLQVGKVNMGAGGSAYVYSPSAAYFPILYTGNGTLVPITLSGTVAFSVAINSGQTYTVTFPTGVFSSAPRVSVSFGPSTNYYATLYPSVWSVSTTSLVIGVSNPGATARGGTLTWVATL